MSPDDKFAEYVQESLKDVYPQQEPEIDDVEGMTFGMRLVLTALVVAVMTVGMLALGTVLLVGAAH